jgi:STE24 endopeptidase
VLELIVAIGAILLMMFSGGGARLRDRIERLARRRWLQDLLLGASLLALLFLITLPLITYAGFVRPRLAGMSGASFPGWLGEQVLRWGIDATFYVAGIVAIMALIRSSPQRWPLHAVAVYLVLYGLYIFVSPVAIDPLFNRYGSLAPGGAREAVLSLARANGVPAEDVYVRDASRQDRPNANVTGLGHTARIVLDDTTMAHATSGVFRLVMAHEIGHYVLGHAGKEWISTTLVWAVGFVLIAWGMRLLQRRLGDRWELREPGNVASIPVFWLLFLCSAFSRCRR